MGCSPKLGEVYKQLDGNLKKHGKKITRDMNCIITYEITDMKGKS